MLLPRRAFLLLAVLPLLFCAKKESASATVTPPASAASPAAASEVPASASPVAAPTASIASTTAATTTQAALATADGETPGVTAKVAELKRSSGGTVSLKFVITNDTNKKLPVGYNYGDPDHQVGDFGSVGGVQLIDAVGKKKYFVARDSDGKCVCSRGLKDIPAGGSVNVWAKFPAPPEDVQKISIVIPHFSPLDDVPIGN